MPSTSFISAVGSLSAAIALGVSVSSCGSTDAAQPRGYGSPSGSGGQAGSGTGIVPPVGGSGGNGGSSIISFPDGGARGDSGLEACATGEAQAARLPVYLLFVLDGSGSMSHDNKWVAATGAIDAIFADMEIEGRPRRRRGAHRLFRLDRSQPQRRRHVSDGARRSHCLRRPGATREADRADRSPRRTPIQHADRPRAHRWLRRAVAIAAGGAAAFRWQESPRPHHRRHPDRPRLQNAEQGRVGRLRAELLREDGRLRARADSAPRAHPDVRHRRRTASGRLHDVRPLFSRGARHRRRLEPAWLQPQGERRGRHEHVLLQRRSHRRDGDRHAAGVHDGHQRHSRPGVIVHARHHAEPRRRTNRPDQGQRRSRRHHRPTRSDGRMDVRRSPAP